MRSGFASPRLWFALGALACAGLLGYALVLQYFQGQDPCPLCLVQRAFFTLVMVVFVIGAVHNPRRTGTAVYSAFAMLAAAGGFAVAARQVWLQHLPKGEVPACGPDLYFMLQNFPLSRTLEKLFTGSGECAEVKWRFLGLSIAEWSLAWFLALALYALWIAARARRAAR
jgi:disulfide bond formation protein DsbB